MTSSSASKDGGVTLTSITDPNETYVDVYGVNARICLSGSRYFERSLFLDDRNATFTTGMFDITYGRNDPILIEEWKSIYAKTDSDRKKFDELFEEIQRRFDWLREYNRITKNRYGYWYKPENRLYCFCGSPAKVRGENSDGEKVVLCDKHHSGISTPPEKCDCCGLPLGDPLHFERAKGRV